MSDEFFKFPCGCRWPIVGPAPRPGAIPRLDVDGQNLPVCSATWEMLGKGLTKGVFQLESSHGQKYCKLLKPTSLEHMAALAAILRPGCLQVRDENGQSVTDKYCLRKNGEQEPTASHPVLAEVLAPTYGLMLYQEQMTKISELVAGFNLVEQDSLRKAAGKKDQQLMAAVGRMFMEKAAAHGIVSAEEAALIFDDIRKSGRYLFNKSHAMSYGITGYETAYLKAHFPVQMFANWLYYAKDKSDPKVEIAELVREAKVFNVNVLVPDVRTVEPHFNTDGVDVRFGLTDIRGVGQAMVQKLVAAIGEGEKASGRDMGTWTWEDWLFNALDSVPSSATKAMVMTGAFEWTGKPRERLKNELEAWADLTKREKEWYRELHAGLPVSHFLGAELPEAPRLDDEQWLSANVSDWGSLTPRQQAGRKKKMATAYAKLLGGVEEIRSATGPFKSLSQGLRAVAKVGAANVKRQAVLNSAADLLDNPPSSEEDTPNAVAWNEEFYLGIALSCSRVDACDVSMANSTCKGFLDGQSPKRVLLAVQVDDVREKRTKSGKSPGSLMANLTVSDGTGSVEVLAWPTEWKTAARVCTQGATVLLEGYRNRKDGGFIINHAYPLV